MEGEAESPMEGKNFGGKKLIGGKKLVGGKSQNYFGGKKLIGAKLSLLLCPPSNERREKKWREKPRVQWRENTPEPPRTDGERERIHSIKVSGPRGYPPTG